MRARAEYKQWAARLLCHRMVGNALGRLFRDRIPSRGCVIDTSGAYISPSAKARLFWRLYERAEIEFIDRYLRPDLDVIELGSGLGVTSCHARRKLAASRQLICVEAEPACEENIKNNLERNCPGHEVIILKRRIGYDRAAAQGSSSPSALQDSPAERLSGQHVTLSGLLKEVGIGMYSLISDVEGAEAGFILHDGEALKRCQQMVIELHESQLPSGSLSIAEQLDLLLQTHGFTLIARRGSVCLLER